MSASGVQLSSDAHLAYFHPTIREYLQSIRTAVVSNNLPEAQQALARLKKAIPASAQTTNAQNSETATRLSAGVQAVAKALEAGDLPGAELAVANLHKDMQSTSEAQVQPQNAKPEPPSGSGADVSSGAGDNTALGPILNVTA